MLYNCDIAPIWYFCTGPLYVALKHVIWRFQICNYCHEIFRFRDFMNTLRNFTKSVFVHIFAKFKYFVKLTESPDHVV